jgi:hypothetical protein
MNHYLYKFIIRCNGRPLLLLHSNVLSAEGRLVTRLQDYSDKTHGNDRVELIAESVPDGTTPDIPAYTPDVYVDMGDEPAALETAKLALDSYFGEMLA